MGDEPRRSGRATKGINPKHREDEPGEGTAKKSKIKGKPTKQEEDGSPPAEEGEEEAIIRCICGVKDDEGGRVMICCDDCAAWQHNDCMGLTEDENELPEQYYCEQCKPQDHKQLIAAIKRGEKPWEAVAKRRDEARRKKKGRGGRKSKGARQSKGGEALEDDHVPEEEEEAQTPVAMKAKQAPDVPMTETHTPPEPIKRKYETETEDVMMAQPTKVRKASSAAKEEPQVSASRRKSGTTKQANRKSTGATPEGAQRARKMHELRNGSRKNTALALKAKLEKQFETLSQKDGYRLPEGKDAAILAEDLSLTIEHSLYMTYCRDVENYGGAYREQFISINYNLQNNTDLLFKVVDGTLSTDELASMSSGEMASKELQEQMAMMKEEADKQAMLVQDMSEGPRIRRTHKGDELVDDQSNQIANESTMAAPPPRRRESEMLDATAAGRSPDVEADIKSPVEGWEQGSPADGTSMDISRVAGMLSSDRRSSSNFDIQNVWSSVHSPDQDQARPSLPPPIRSASGINAAQGDTSQQNDADIDRLLDEDGNESPPYSPAELSADSSVTWQGTLDMPVTAGESVAKFKAIAHHVAGSNLVGRTTFEAIFPPDLVLHGRIEDKRADKYLTSLSAARSTDVTVHSIVPIGGNESAAQAQFDKLFSYFVTRQRYGVVGDKLHRSNIRDIYVVPLEDGFGEMPTFLQRLDYNIIEQPRPHRMLLVVFVIRWEDGSSSTHATPSQFDGQSIKSPQQQMPQGPHGTNQTPIPRAEAAMSPIIGGGTTNNNPQAQQQAFQLPNHSAPPTGQFPQYPYAPSYTQSAQDSISKSPEIIELAKQILGSYYNSPTAQFVISNQDVDEAELKGLRHVFDNYPVTVNDMSAFAAHFNQQQQASAAQQGRESTR